MKGGGRKLNNYCKKEKKKLEVDIITSQCGTIFSCLHKGRQMFHICSLMIPINLFRVISLSRK